MLLTRLAIMKNLSSGNYKLGCSLWLFWSLEHAERTHHELSSVVRFGISSFLSHRRSIEGRRKTSGISQCSGSNCQNVNEMGLCGCRTIFHVKRSTVFRSHVWLLIIMGNMPEAHILRTLIILSSKSDYRATWKFSSKLLRYMLSNFSGRLNGPLISNSGSG